MSLLVAAVLLLMPGTAYADRHRVRAGEDRWRPTHVFMTAGDTVVWTNPDDRRHNIVAYGGGWHFNRMLEPGETARRLFDQVRGGGNPYRYRCTLHSAIADGRCEGMCGLIHVFSA